MQNEMSFDVWVSLNGCDFCRESPDKRNFCMLCKNQWLIDMYYLDEDRKIIDSIEEEE